jgi:hypothetical protein
VLESAWEESPAVPLPPAFKAGYDNIESHYRRKIDRIMRRTLILTGFVLLVYACIELISYAGLTCLDYRYGMSYRAADSLSYKQRDILKRLLEGESKYIEFDSTLGWTNKANGEIQSDCSSRIIKSNSSGIRSDREYDLLPPPDVLRIAAFGDSFTHCEDVGNKETWEVFMESLINGLEVLNFGVNGYGLDQAYLRYLKDGQRYKPDMVFIGFITDDISRHSNNFRPFVRPNTRLPLSKPRYLIENDRLVLIPNPISKLEDYRTLLNNTPAFLNDIGANDSYYPNNYKSSPFDASPTVRLIKLAAAEIKKRIRMSSNNKYNNQKSESYIITLRIFGAFYNEAIRNNSIPIIIIFPTRSEMLRYKNYKTKTYTPLLKYFDSKGYRYIDLMDALSNCEEDTAWNDKCGHYSPFENREAAEYMLDYLRKNKFIK